MATYDNSHNEQVQRWREEHIAAYEAPKVEGVIVGFSGIDPDRKAGEGEKAELEQLVKDNIQEMSGETIKEMVDEAVAAASSDLPNVASDEDFESMMDEVLNEA